MKRNCKGVESSHSTVTDGTKEWPRLSSDSRITEKPLDIPRNPEHNPRRIMRRSLTKTIHPTVSRRSRERELIWDQVQTMKGHFTAEELVFSLARQRKRVSRATVYRTLDLLLDRGVLLRVQVGEGGALYELGRSRPPHAHLYCLGCGRLSDYPLAMLSQLPRRVLRDTRFQTDHLLLRICGYCQPCRLRLAKKKRLRRGKMIQSRKVRQQKAGKLAQRVAEKAGARGANG